MADTTEHLRKLADLFLTGRDAPRNEPRNDLRNNPRNEPQYEPHHEPLAPDHEWTPRTEEEEDDNVDVETQIECIIVGHLPVRAGLWLTQYADDIAREQGPTGLIRLDGDQCILEVLRSDETAARISSADTLPCAAQAIAPQVRRWIVRPPSGRSAEDVVRAHPDWVTILSGADEIAVVAAYRVIKDLFECAQRTAMPLPPVELAILGANEERARRAAEKIAATAWESLDIEVHLARCVQQMGPLGSTLHFRFPSDKDHDLAELIDSIRHPFVEPVVHDERAQIETPGPQWLDARSSRVAKLTPAPPALPLRTLATTLMEDQHTSEPQPSPAHPLRRHMAAEIATPVVGPSFGGLPDSPHADAPPPIPTSPPARSSEPVRLRPKPSVHVEPKRIIPNPPARETPEPKPLSTWIDGLALLRVRCPDARAIEICVDTHGCAHLVAWEDHLRDLPIVQAWLRKHLELVQMACPDYEIAADKPFERHVFTAEPVRVADLHGCGIHLHILAPVEVEGKRGWYAALLSA